jgi:hypothetical protein
MEENPYESSKRMPMFEDGVRIGYVTDIIPHPGFFRGRLILDQRGASAQLASVVALARDVDAASPEDYQAVWYRWRAACNALQGIYIGDSAPEELTIESDYQIEWLDSRPTSP